MNVLTLLYRILCYFNHKCYWKCLILIFIILFFEKCIFCCWIHYLLSLRDKMLSSMNDCLVLNVMLFICRWVLWMYACLWRIGGRDVLREVKFPYVCLCSFSSFTFFLWERPCYIIDIAKISIKSFMASFVYVFFC